MLKEIPCHYEVIYWTFCIYDPYVVSMGSWEYMTALAEQFFPGREWYVDNGMSVIIGEEHGQTVASVTASVPPLQLANIIAPRRSIKNAGLNNDLIPIIKKALGLERVKINPLVLGEILRLDPFRRAVRIGALKEEGL